MRVSYSICELTQYKKIKKIKNKVRRDEINKETFHIATTKIRFIIYS